MVSKEHREEMLAQYIATALWSSNDESDESGGEPLDRNYSREDIAPSTLVLMELDVLTFILDNEELIKSVFGRGREAIDWGEHWS